MSGFLNKDNLPHLIQKLTDGDNIKITGNKHGDRVGKVINKLIDKSNETLGASFKELKNEEYSFKTGEGSGVDLSNSTLDSFTTFALEGNTYKNLVKNGAEELVLNPEINKEGTGFELDGTFDGGQLEFEVEGQTLKNYMPIEEMKYISAGPPSIGYINTIDTIAANKTYTILFNNINFNVTSILLKIPEATTFYSNAFTLRNNTLRVKIELGETIPKGHNINPHFYGNATEEQLKKVRCMILEGDYTQKEVPFFEGIQGVGRKSKNVVKGEFTRDRYINKSGELASSRDWASTDYLEVLPNTQYTQNKSLSNSTVTSCSFYDSDKRFISMSQKNTYTTPSNCKFLRTCWKYTEGGLEDFQVEEGDEATPYEPHWEGYRIGLKTRGKNLFDIKTVIRGGYIRNTDGALVMGTPDWGSTDFIEVTPNKHYIQNLSQIGAGVTGLCFYDKNKKFIKAFENKGQAPQNAKYLRTCWKLRIDGERFQIEEGTQATNYEPYKESINEIILQDQLQRVGDIKDRLYFDEGYKVEKRVSITRLTGNERWELWDGWSDARKSFGVCLSNFLQYDRDNIECLASNYPTGLEYSAEPQIYLSRKTSKIYLTINRGELREQSLQAAIEWIKNKQITLYHSSKKPQIIELSSPKQLISTFNIKTCITQDSGLKGNLKISNKGYKTYNLLPNKEYTVMVDKRGNSPITLDLCGVKKVVDGDRGTLSTSTNNLGELKFYGNGKIKNIRLLEGNVLNKTIGYFEGVQGVGEGGAIKAKTCGKNLFSSEDSKKVSHSNVSFGGEFISFNQNGSRFYVTSSTGFKEKTSYVLSYTCLDTGSDSYSTNISIVYTDKTEQGLNARAGQTVSLKTNPAKTVDKIMSGWYNGNRSVITNVQLEEASETTSHELHEESDFSIELEESLMRLPNEVYDEITKDGKLIRRTGKVVLTGDEDWQIGAGINGEGRYGVINNINLGIKDGLNMKNQLSDKMTLRNPYENYSNCVWGLKQGGREYVRLRYEGKETTPEEFKARLKKEPIILWYELAQPIITDIKPLQARLFKNGHIIFDNKIAPVSTYEVAVNKPAQINAGIKETQKLENRVNALEGLYDSMLLENSHILSNLEFDFSLMKEVEE